MDVILDPERYRALARSPEHLGVFAFLAAENGLRARFMIADGLAERMGWPRRLIPAARQRFIEIGLIERVGRDPETGAYLYRWAAAEPAGELVTKGGEG